MSGLAPQGRGGRLVLQRVAGAQVGPSPLDLAEVLSFLEHGRALARRGALLTHEKRKG